MARRLLLSRSRTSASSIGILSVWRPCSSSAPDEVPARANSGAAPSPLSNQSLYCSPRNISTSAARDDASDHAEVPSFMERLTRHQHRLALEPGKRVGTGGSSQRRPDLPRCGSAGCTSRCGPSRDSEPVLIWPALVPTTRSAISESPVSPGAMRNHVGVRGALGHLDGGKGFRQRADLVDFDQDRIGDALLDAFAQDFGVGDEQVIADQLHLLAELSVSIFQPSQSPSAMPSSMLTIRSAAQSAHRSVSSGALVSERPSPSRWYLPSRRNSLAAVKAERDLLAGLVASLLNCLHQRHQRFFV